MQSAFMSLFQNLASNIQVPLFNALNSVNIIKTIISFLNNILNGLFNIYRQTPVNTDYISVLLISEIITLIILIVMIVFFVKLIKKAFNFILDIAYGTTPNTTNTWRKQWRRKKW